MRETNEDLEVLRRRVLDRLAEVEASLPAVLRRAGVEAETLERVMQVIARIRTAVGEAVDHQALWLWRARIEDMARPMRRPDR